MLNQNIVKLRNNDSFFPMAFIISMAMAPEMSVMDNVKRAQIYTKKPDAVCCYAFDSADINEESIDLGWHPVVPSLVEASYSAEKYSVCIFGPLSFSYGDPVITMDIDEIKLNYCIADRGISIDMDMIRAEILCIIESRYGKPVIDFTFGTVSAKVKQLDPNCRFGKKCQDNVFSMPHDFDRLIEWHAVEPVSAS